MQQVIVFFQDFLYIHHILLDFTSLRLDRLLYGLHDEFVLLHVYLVELQIQLAQQFFSLLISGFILLQMNFLHLSLKICGIAFDISNVPINLLFILKHLIFLFFINKLFLELDELLVEFLDAVDAVHEGVDVLGSLPS